ncbi:3-oxoadipate enol-lactonase [Acidicapsa ligni]|uniref:3-oxoadipate enol-lactonase n=1 Tax=Acidicapsa ligni TaxID=542300 RepID=UPI0021E07784|nr:3-oxoadipate enol-lactonase [Acidicapsa ligni]
MAFAELQSERGQSVRIHYQLIGDASLPVLVLSHSLGVALDMWQLQVAALLPHFRLLQYDTRGHGGSSVPPGPYGVEDLGPDVLGLLDALQIETFSFCGLSMGGAIGQWLGIHASTRLQKLVLANTAARIGQKDIWNARIAQVLSEGLGPIIPGTLERWFTRPFRDMHPEIISHTADMLRQTSVDGYAACCAAVRDLDLRATICQIATPTLVISGVEDPVTSPADGKFLADQIRDARYEVLQAAHLSNIEAASEFNFCLLAFLRD